VRVKVYTASKLSDGPLWRQLSKEWPEIEIVARWPFLHVTDTGEPGWPRDCTAHGSIFWQHDHDDVAACRVVLVYTPIGGTLRGALVEAGMGIALGKIVIVVGDHPDFGTWQFHPLVKRVATLDAARSLLRLIGTSS
jgi:hypothetical protein